MKNIKSQFIKAFLLACSLVLLQGASFAQEPVKKGQLITGPAAPSDGDTFTIEDVKIDLFGIDAPEKKQFCSRANGSAYKCGQASVKHLKSLLEAGDLSCVIVKKKKKGPMIGECKTSDGADLATQMLANGYAWSTFENEALTAAMKIAVDEKKGIWNGHSTPPWIWRKMKRADIIFPTKRKKNTEKNPQASITAN